jgi:hypothetical protein
MAIIFFAVLSDAIKDISEEGWSGDVNWDLYLQMVCWFGAISAVLTSANPRLTLKWAIVITALSSVPFFFYGAYTMRLEAAPDSESSSMLQRLEEKESKPIRIVFVGERGVLYLTAKVKADSSKTANESEKPTTHDAPLDGSLKFRIEFTPHVEHRFIRKRPNLRKDLVVLRSSARQSLVPR